ncbi:MAG: response regulator transcription factor [Dehalococcoidales bacterium]|nr:response regulator transcription factor [Dehalococcoidales bacterium]
MATGKTILTVEDDETLVDVLKYNFTREGYQVVTALDGTKALELARRERPDLIVLDIMLPGIDGFEVCRILRREMTVPILMLTAKEEEIDKVVGLEIGADDYITKPFSMRELLARIRAMLRRAEMKEPAPAPANEVMLINDLAINIARRKVSLGGAILNLTPKEFDLLAFLAKNKGIVFSREQLLEKVWGYDYAGNTRTVDVHIRWLREKIEADPGKPRYLITVRGIGYKLEE